MNFTDQKQAKRKKKKKKKTKEEKFSKTSQGIEYSSIAIPTESKVDASFTAFIQWRSVGRFPLFEWVLLFHFPLWRGLPGSPGCFVYFFEPWLLVYTHDR